tara:strand:+ start:213 stop:920 length:708 start_codon:yes stop_codon:yes gene_type:complete
MLPKLNAPTYSLELPSTGEQIKFRPFLVKEQKLLMMAQESDDQQQVIDAVSKIISSCTFQKVDPLTSPLFDIEYVFIKLRSKSVGENVEVRLLCPDDEETYVTTKISLEDVGISVGDEHTNKIQLTDKIKLVMKYPQIMDMKGLSFGEMKQFEMVFSILKHCIWEVHDGDTVYNKVDLKLKDLEEFIDSFDVSQLEEVMKFFNTMPKVTHTVKVKNPKTQVESDVVIEGLESFLG